MLVSWMSRVRLTKWAPTTQPDGNNAFIDKLLLDTRLVEFFDCCNKYFCLAKE